MPLAARAAPALLVLATGCWVPLERGRQMDARIARLEVETREQARALDEQVRDKIGQVDRKLKEVQAKLDELNTSARAKGADLGVAVGRLQEELTRLRGDLEAQQHLLGQLDAAVKSGARETEARLAALKGTGALDDAMARQKLSELPRPDDRAAVLALAQKEDGAGEKGVARELYQHYVRRWPRDEKADEAGLRAGEILASQGRWREAVVVLGKVAEDHPKSDKAGPALLLVAEGMVQLDRKDDARAFLEQVVAEHPKTEAAGKAKARLAELFPPKKAPPKKK
ncbi:MAG: tetratricopeptide repeat protein [Anaeromyxobacteraceae bacterium]|nr:tetratricopeptide repeat protein [Anaeromyxobacteraceae bacterium]